MFSLRTLLVVVAVAAVFAAALITDSPLLVGLATALPVVLLIAASVAAIRPRAFVAFAVTGLSYLVVVLTPSFAPLAASLPTTMLLAAVEQEKEGSAELSISDGRDFVRRVRRRHFSFLATPNNLLISISGDVDVVDRNKLMVIGHCGFALLFAAIAEVIARRNMAAGRIRQ